MLFKILQRMIGRGQTEGLQEKIDVFYAVGRITDEQYNELCVLMGLEVPAATE